MTEPKTINFPDKSYESLISFVAELRSKYLTWYKKDMKDQVKYWKRSQISVYAASLFAVIASATKQGIYQSPWLTLEATRDVAMVLLPAIAAMLTALSERFRKLEKLREEGQISIEEILHRFDYEIANMSDPEKDIPDIHKKLIDNISRVERSQNNDYFIFTGK
jgi:hypothetical protein